MNLILDLNTIMVNMSLGLYAQDVNLSLDVKAVTVQGIEGESELRVFGIDGEVYPLITRTKMNSGGCATRDDVCVNASYFVQVKIQTSKMV